LKDGRRYIGCTSDLVSRLKRHNEGLVKSTRYRKPFTVVYSEEFETMTQARKRELKLKSFKGGDIIKKLIREYKTRE